MVWRYGAVLRGYGASPRAIEAAGWSTRLAKASLYGFAGLFAFLAGILVTASTRGGDPTGSTSMTLLSVAAVILGGAAFSGGVVAPIGALFGTLTLVLVGTLLSLLGVNAVFLPMVQGLLLLGVIGVRTLLIGRRGADERPLARSPGSGRPLASLLLLAFVFALSDEFRSASSPPTSRRRRSWRWSASARCSRSPPARAASTCRSRS